MTWQKGSRITFSFVLLLFIIIGLSQIHSSVAKVLVRVKSGGSDGAGQLEHRLR
jgi:hypothetical protein